MSKGLPPAPKLELRPLTPEAWDDFLLLFGEHGAGGCWYMWWRVSKQRFAEQRGEGNKRALKELIDAGQVPGVLAYIDGKPAAWCAVGPRSDFPRLPRSFPALKGLAAAGAWSIVCFLAVIVKYPAS